MGFPESSELVTELLVLKVQRPFCFKHMILIKVAHFFNKGKNDACKVGADSPSLLCGFLLLFSTRWWINRAQFSIQSGCLEIGRTESASTLNAKNVHRLDKVINTVLPTGTEPTGTLVLVLQLSMFTIPPPPGLFPLRERRWQGCNAANPTWMWHLWQTT